MISNKTRENQWGPTSETWVVWWWGIFFILITCLSCFYFLSLTFSFFIASFYNNTSCYYCTVLVSTHKLSHFYRCDSSPLHPLALYTNTWKMEWQNYFWNVTIEIILMEKKKSQLLNLRKGKACGILLMKCISLLNASIPKHAVDNISDVEFASTKCICCSWQGKSLAKEHRTNFKSRFVQNLFILHV